MNWTIKDIDLNTIDAVIFDFDGTVYNKSQLFRRLAMGQLHVIGLLARERIIRKRLRGVYVGSEEQFYDKLFSMMASGQPFSASLARTWYNKDYMPTMVRTLKYMYHPEPWVVDLFRDLRAAGKKVAIYSDYGLVHQKMEALGIDVSSVDLAISAPELGGLKPARESMLKLADMLGVQPERCLMIGDRMETDGESAKRVGAQFLLVNNK